MSVPATGKKEFLWAKIPPSFLTPFGHIWHLLHQQTPVALASTCIKNAAASHHLHRSQAEVTTISLWIIIF